MECYTVKEAAAKLGRSPRTIHRYIHAGVFPDLTVIAHPKRNHYVFTDSVIKAFQARAGISRRDQDVQPIEQPAKRAYHRTYKKGQHKKTKKRGKKAS